MKSGISKRKDKVIIRLSPQYILAKPAFSPDTKHMFGFTFGQLIQGFALAELALSAPHLFKDFATARVSATPDGFIVEFMDNLAGLTDPLP